MAEELTISTYYPSPRGVYDELVANHLRIKESLRFDLDRSPLSRPACTAETRGTLWFERDEPVEDGAVDRLLFCAQVLGQPQWVMVLGAGT